MFAGAKDAVPSGRIQKSVKYSKNFIQLISGSQPKQGKVTVKELAKQNAGMVNIEITDKNIKSFERYARKYGINYALKKDKSKEPPVYLVFFKGRDQDALNAAFREFSQKQICWKPVSISSISEISSDMRIFLQRWFER